MILSIAGLWWMLDLSIDSADTWRIAASSIYGLSLVTLFFTSTLYHGMHGSPHRDVFKLLDHCAIYLLIAGSSTPFLLVALRTNTSWWLFAAMWLLAVIGILSKIIFRHRFPRVSLAGYLLMGWLMLVVMPELTEVIGADGLYWVIASGLCYSVGALFYTRKKMYLHHAIWHVFVLAGAACGFFAVAIYVLPVVA